MGKQQLNYFSKTYSKKGQFNLFQKYYYVFLKITIQHELIQNYKQSPKVFETIYQKEQLQKKMRQFDLKENVSSPDSFFNQPKVEQTLSFQPFSKEQLHQPQPTKKSFFESIKEEYHQYKRLGFLDYFGFEYKNEVINGDKKISLSRKMFHFSYQKTTNDQSNNRTDEL